MKKLALLLALCITTLSLASCGKANKVDEPVETSVEDTETTEVSENTVTETYSWRGVRGWSMCYFGRKKKLPFIHTCV